MAVGAWQDMFKVVNLEDRPIEQRHNQQVLYNDGINEIVMKNVFIIFSIAHRRLEFFTWKE